MRATSFDEAGLIDPKAREIVARLMAAFEVWVRRFAPEHEAARRPVGSRTAAARRAGVTPGAPRQRPRANAARQISS